MAVKTVVKKWGSSLGVVLPKELVKKEQLKPNESILIEVVKEADIRDTFGTLKRKMSGQKFKDMVRAGWG